MKHLFVCLALFLTFATPTRASVCDEAEVHTVLNNFHGAAARADWDRYFSFMTEDSIFLGTDATERWDKPTFMAFAHGTKGWTYTVRERHINFTPDENSVWFDELLHNEKYGTSRGTGILIRQNGTWKIAQYHLVFPIPNDLAAGITEQIQAFERAQKAGQK